MSDRRPHSTQRTRQAPTFVRALVARAKTDPKFRESLARVVAAKQPTYEAYVERKRKEGKKPLDRERWERKVFGIPSERGRPRGRARMPRDPSELTPLFSPDESAHLPYYARQKHGDADSLMEEAKEAHDQMVHWLDEGHGIDRALGASVVRRDLDSDAVIDPDAPGPMVIIGPRKLRKTAQKRVNARYEGDWRDAIDLVRSTIAVDSYDQLHDVVQKLRESGMELAGAPRNRFIKPTDTGYADVIIPVRLPNGHVGEIQLHLKEFLRAKEKAHPYYDRIKNVSNGWGKVKGPSKEEIAKDKAKVREIYDRAWEAVRKPEELPEPLPFQKPEPAEAPAEEAVEEAVEEVVEEISLFSPPKPTGTEGKTAADDDVDYYELDGLPVRWETDNGPRFHGAGPPKLIDSMAAFVERSRTIPKEEFEELVREREKNMTEEPAVEKTSTLTGLLQKRAAKDPEFRRELLAALRKRRDG